VVVTVLGIADAQPNTSVSWQDLCDSYSRQQTLGLDQPAAGAEREDAT